MLKYFLALLLAFPAFAAQKPQPSVLVLDNTTKRVVYESNGYAIRPIASITKLATGMTTIDRYTSLDQELTFDIKTRLLTNTATADTLLNSVLTLSDNGAADILADNFPAGRSTFLMMMNQRAQDIGLHNTTFADPSGLDNRNVSTAYEVAVMASWIEERYPLIRSYSTMKYIVLEKKKKNKTITRLEPNTSSSILSSVDGIKLSKTGYTQPAGWCSVFVVERGIRSYTVVVLGAKSKSHRIELAKKAVKSYTL